MTISRITIGFSAITLCGSLFFITPVIAQTLDVAKEGKELNLYSARHYQTDEALYSDFTKKNGYQN